MHTVDRGLEPPGLADIRMTLTPKWIAHYRHGKGKKPGDSRWRQFQPDLSKAFFGICGYCEEICKGEVDHFRPKSKFPERVYEWSNWVLACHICNNEKGEEWPTNGYVDPCSSSPRKSPEACFDYDPQTGELLLRQGLTAELQSRAEQTRRYLRLDAAHHLKKRQRWLDALEGLAAGKQDWELSLLAETFTSRNEELSSLSLAFFRKKGCQV